MGIKKENIKMLQKSQQKTTVRSDFTGKNVVIHFD